MDGADRERLIEKIRDPDPARRGEAAYQMGGTGDPSFLPFLEQALDDLDPKVRWRAVQAVGKLELPHPSPRVPSLLRDASAQVRAEAVTILGRWGLKEHVQALSPLLQDPDVGVRYKTIEALGEIREVDTPLLERIAAFLEDPHGSLRMHAALALGKCRHPPAAPSLIRRLKDPQHTVRGPAAWSLGQLRDEIALEPLVQALQDEGEYVRIYVYQAIAAFGKRAIPVLEKELASAGTGYRALLQRLIDDIREGDSEEEGSNADCRGSQEPARKP